jgi:alpha-glucosidase (family GH31 glycosyl hydrolase)
MPFYRAHAHEATKYREPWTFGTKLLDEIRDVLRFRYELLPYIYTCFEHSRVKGEPLMRPLWFNYPDDSNNNMIEDQFMLGEDILVKALADEGQDRYVGSGQWIQMPPRSLVYLPKGDDWISLEALRKIGEDRTAYDKAIVEGGQTIQFDCSDR